MAINAINITYPVAPGPVRKLASRKPFMPVFVAMAKRAKFTQCAIVWTQEKNTMDQAVSLWKVMFLSKSMMLFSGVWRSSEIRPRQTATC